MLHAYRLCTEWFTRFADCDIFMRYFGGGIGHIMYAAPKTQFTLDSAPFNSKWEDVDDDMDDVVAQGVPNGTFVNI